jgi:hypothetical protein
VAFIPALPLRTDIDDPAAGIARAGRPELAAASTTPPSPDREPDTTRRPGEDRS